MKTNRLKQFLIAATLSLAAISVIVATVCYLLARASLPQLDGRIKVQALLDKVVVIRDSAGVPTIKASSREDAAYATGFVHAQERFFQMDLLRRSAAGELAALLGSDAVETDRVNRFYRFRALAEQTLTKMPVADRRLLDRYVKGVNDGLSALSAPPFEYLLLGTSPKDWRAADTLLTIRAMYLDLQSNLEPRELARGWLRSKTDLELLRFLLPEASRYDSPLNGNELLPLKAIPVQGPTWLGATAPPNAQPGSVPLAAVGSNAWTVEGTHAMVANDMHLSLRLPNTWYRLQLLIGNVEKTRLIGVSLPGTPLVIVGSNGNVAWGFTNSYGDYLDLIPLQRDPLDRTLFHTPQGSQRAQVIRERIEVAGQPSVELEILSLSSGPVRTVNDQSYAVHWVALHPDAADLGLLRLEGATDVRTAIASANAAGMPAQNMLVVDHQGRSGWTIAGSMLQRNADWASTFPISSYPGKIQLRAAADHPQFLPKAGSVLWSANSRQLAGEAYRSIGDGGADLGVRSTRIRNMLDEKTPLNEKEMMAVALDTSASLMGEWRELALRALDNDALIGHPARAQFKQLLVDAWSDDASADSIGYRLARAYHYAIYTELFGQVDAALERQIPGATFEQANLRWSTVASRLLIEKPSGWLPKGRSWAQIELAAIDRAIRNLGKNDRELNAVSWGEQNKTRIAHPFADTLPFLNYWLTTPMQKQAGDDHMPRVSSPDFGQSERMVVAPGKEEQGLFNMPGGQSGHPLSSYFLTGHSEWLSGESLPLLPGLEKYNLTFEPAEQ